jgi:hypothetical protein
MSISLSQIVDTNQKIERERTNRIFFVLLNNNIKRNIEQPETNTGVNTTTTTNNNVEESLNNDKFPILELLSKIFIKAATRSSGSRGKQNYHEHEKNKDKY